MRKILLLAGLGFLLLCSSVQSFSPIGDSERNSLFLDLDQTVYTQTNTIILYNPYEDIDFETINHYKTNLHTHTTESDGSSTPSEVIYQYHHIGQYDILSITDHNKNTWPWSDWISETPLESSKSSEYYPALEMLAISGDEMSLGHHRNSLLNDYGHGGFFSFFAFWYIQQQEGLGFFNHPGRYDYSADWYQRFFDAYNGCVIGVEVFNQGDRYPNDRHLWDEINKDRDPDDLIWGFSNDDMHKISSHAFRNYQHFLMEDLTEPEFRKAMTNGAFYFSYEPNGADSESLAYGQAMTPRLQNVIINNTIITINGENTNSIQWYDQNSQIVGTNNQIDVTSIESNFVRAVLRNEYGLTYTQPFGIEKIYQILD